MAINILAIPMAKSWRSSPSQNIFKLTIMNIKTTKRLLILILTVLLVSCKIGDDLSDCGILISYIYNLNPQGVDKFSTDVGKLNLYIFDESGVLVDEYEDIGPFGVNYKKRILGLPAGTYTFVVWGGLNNPVSHERGGLNRLYDQKLTLATKNEAGKYVIDTSFGALFYGSSMKVTVTSSAQDELVIGLMKDTKTIHVIFNNVPMDAATAGQFVCRIEAANGDYNFSNEVLGNRLITYMPHRTVNKQVLTLDFVTLRLFDDGIFDARLVLEYIQADGTPVTILDCSLIEAIKHEYPNVDFIIDDEFTLIFDVHYTDGNFSVTINGWTPVPFPTIVW